MVDSRCFALDCYRILVSGNGQFFQWYFTCPRSFSGIFQKHDSFSAMEPIFLNFLCICLVHCHNYCVSHLLNTMSQTQFCAEPCYKCCFNFACHTFYGSHSLSKVKPGKLRHQPNRTIITVRNLCVCLAALPVSSVMHLLLKLMV